MQNLNFFIFSALNIFLSSSTNFFQSSYKDHVALFFDHLLEDILSFMQDSPPAIALKEVRYDAIGIFLGLSLDIIGVNLPTWSLPRLGKPF